MLTRWFEIDPTQAALEELRRFRELATLFEEWEPEGPRASLSWPRANLYDLGEELLLRAEVPGLDEKDLEIQVLAEVLSVSGERKVEPPEGYSAHRRERGGVRFSRSFTFPVRIDADRVSAEVRDGLLSVRLPKAAEVRPRASAVQAG